MTTNSSPCDHYLCVTTKSATIVAPDVLGAGFPFRRVAGNSNLSRCFGGKLVVTLSGRLARMQRLKRNGRGIVLPLLWTSLFTCSGIVSTTCLSVVAGLAPGNFGIDHCGMSAPGQEMPHWSRARDEHHHLAPDLSAGFRACARNANLPGQACASGIKAILLAMGFTEGRERCNRHQGPPAFSSAMLASETGCATKE